MNGLYKVRLTTKGQLSRIETIYDYFMTTLYSDVEQLTETIDDSAYYKALGSWTKSVFDNFRGQGFEVVFEMSDDWLSRFWYIDEDNTIRQEVCEKYD